MKRRGTNKAQKKDNVIISDRVEEIDESEEDSSHQKVEGKENDKSPKFHNGPPIFESREAYEEYEKKYQDINDTTDALVIAFVIAGIIKLIMYIRNNFM